MSRHGGSAGKTGHDFARVKGFCQRYRCCTFCHVQYEGGQPSLQSHMAEYVECPDIAVTHLADVYAFCSADEVGERDRPQQVSQR